MCIRLGGRIPAGTGPGRDHRLHLDAVEGERTVLGHIDCPSGRLVVGTPGAVAAWCDEIEPDCDLLAQARAYRPDRRHCGHVIVARVEHGRRQVLAVAGNDGYDAIVVDCTAPPESTDYVTVGMVELLIAG